MTQEEEDRKVKERAKHGSSRSSTSADDKESKLRVRPRRSGASKPGAVPETSSSRGSEKAPRDDESRSHRAKSSRSGSSGPGAVPETSSSRGSEKARRDDESRSGRSDRRKPAVEASSSSVSSGTASPNSRKERMVSRQREDQEAKSRAKRSMTDGSVVSIGTRFGGGSRHNHSRHEERDTVAKNAARLPRSTATSIEPGAESVSMESPRTTSSKSRSKAGYPPSFADDDRAAGLKAPPFAAAVPNSPSGEKGETPSRNMLQKDLSAVELQATLVEEEGEDRKLKRLVEMERRLKQQMQDLHQHQTQPQTQDLNAAIVGNADSPSPAEEGNRSKKRGIIVGVIVLVLAIGGGIAGFFFSQKDSNDETPLASNPTDAPTVPGNPTVPPIMSMLTDMPTADLSYDPPSRAECRVMEQGGTLDVGQNVIIKDFVVQLDVMISVQTSESLWLDELKQRLQEKVVPDLVGCFDVQRNLGERDESSLPQVDRKLNEGSRYVVKFGLVEAVLGRSCTEPSSLCKRVDVSLTLFLKGDENNLFFYGLISNSFGATSDDSLVQILDLRTPISSIGVEGVSTGALTEAPTPLPTSELTKNPTPAPTKTPTLAPTKNPTKSPTHAPEPTTEAPTRAPTTERPTSAPEPGATPQPTSTPTCVNMDSFFARNRYDEEDGASDESYQVDCDSDTALVVLTRDENSCQVTCRASRSYNSVFDQLCDDNGDVTVLLQGDYRGQTLYIGQLDDGVSFNCPQALMLATPEPTKDPTPDPSPSPTPDPTPPPTTVQPTAEPTTFCEDYSNWVDSYGDTCKSFYSTDAECQEWGNEAYADGIPANQACCTCGGGLGVNEPQPTQRPSERCDDYEDWLDSNGNWCDYYAFDSSYCSAAPAYENHCAIDAREACCLCGGGLGSGDSEPYCAPETSPPTNDDNCQNYRTWSDAAEDGCEWYEENGCSDAGDYVNEYNIDADAACCVCGGGLDSSCTDYPTWSDSSEDGCEWYEENGCSLAGDYVNECNIDANASCCVCDGGLQPGEDEPTC